MTNKEHPLKNKGFIALFCTQFLGALNDNIFKNALVVVLAFKSVQLWGLGTESLVALSGGIFILPFFLFSALAGQFSDKFQKTKIIRIVKICEVLFMLLAAYGFYSHHFSLLMIVLFLMGLHSAFFGPLKYSIIPELLSEKDLVAGNAYVEVGTFLAILIGMILGGVAAQLPSPLGETIIVSSVIITALIGALSSFFVPIVPVADAQLVIPKNQLKQIWDMLKLTTPNKAVFNSILGISWFWFFGAGFLSLLPVLPKNSFHATESVFILFLAVFTIGVAIGAIACSKLSFQRVEIGLVPWGSLGITLFLLDFAYVVSTWPLPNPGDQLLTVWQFILQPGSMRVLFDLMMVSIFGGIFTVPLYTVIQERSERRIRSRVVASNNIMNALFMVVSSLMLIGFYSMNLTLPQIIVIYAALNLLVSIYIYSVVPEFTLRFLSWVLARLVYRIHTKGIENIPKEGPAVLVCNHVSYVDWLILAAVVQRPVRFVMHYKFFKIPLVRYLFYHARVIPIASQTENKEIFDAAFDTVSRELQAGELICIFPEGTLTKDGELQPFKRGIEHILKRDPVPVIPLALGGMWDSVFSHKDGKFLKRIPERIWSHVDVQIGEPVKASEANAAYLEKCVRNLLAEPQTNSEFNASSPDIA